MSGKQSSSSKGPDSTSGSELSSGKDWVSSLRARAGTSKRVSWLLDECIRIPGTKFRFGLDPLLGLLPYGGETVATLIGAVILGEAGKKGIPLRTLAKMGGNMMLNATLGVMPGIGDLFSFWFKSNSRNYKLLDTYLDSDDGTEEGGGWWPLLLVVGVIAFVLIMNVLAWIMFTLVLTWLWKEVVGSSR